LRELKWLQINEQECFVDNAPADNASPMPEPLVAYTVQDRIARITLNRTKALNAINAELDAELASAWDRFESDEAADVAILHANGRAFCVGADLASVIPKWEHASFGDLRKNTARGLGGGITRGRHRLYKPIIAAVHGHAVGAGFELALACDIRVASEDAVFGVFEVRAGLHQGDGGLVRLLAIAGLGVASELTLTGRPVPAEEALRLHLVSKVVPRDDLLPEAERIARQILSNSQKAVRSAKETLMELVGRPLDDALRLETLYGYSSFGDPASLQAQLAQWRAAQAKK
jgi:enoyl-CoA hydratase/carnithine racemase